MTMGRVVREWVADRLGGLAAWVEGADAVPVEQWSGERASVGPDDPRERRWAMVAIPEVLPADEEAGVLEVSGWSLHWPDLPGCTSFAATWDEIGTQARDAVASYLDPWADGIAAPQETGWLPDFLADDDLNGFDWAEARQRELVAPSARPVVRSGVVLAMARRLSGWVAWSTGSRSDRRARFDELVASGELRVDHPAMMAASEALSAALPLLERTLPGGLDDE